MHKEGFFYGVGRRRSKQMRLFTYLSIVSYRPVIVEFIDLQAPSAGAYTKSDAGFDYHLDFAISPASTGDICLFLRRYPW